jgi:hypothetical protein
MVVFYVPDVFAASDCEVSSSLSYVCLVASFTCHFVDDAPETRRVNVVKK